MSKTPSRWRQSAREMKDLRVLVVTALLLALNLVVDRLTTVIAGPTLHANISFLTKALTGAFYGPVVALYAGTINDVVGYIAYPKGPFILGFTISSALTGLLYALLLYKKPFSWWRILLAQMAVTVVVDMALNTLWLSMAYSSPLIPLLVSRVVPKLIQFPISAGLAMLFIQGLSKALKAIESRA